MTKRWRMHEVLQEAGRQEMPAPGPEFVRDLEARLGTDRIVAAPPVTRGPWRPLGAVAAAAAVIVAVLVLQTGDGQEQRVTTEPSTSSTTSTSTSSTTSTTNTTTTSVVPSTSTVPVFVPAIPTTTSTTAVPTSTTIDAAPTTTTTVEPTTTTTTTTAPSEQQDLGLLCVTREATSVVVCEWSESRSETFARFRLWKHTGDGPDQEVYSGADTRHEDTERVGARMFYEVTALDREGNVLGHGDATITCC